MNYPKTCEYTHGEDYFGNSCKIIKGTCVHTECRPEYELINGACQPCDRENALSYNQNGNCRVESCIYGFHPNGDKCEENTIECDAPNAAAAERVWNSAANAYTNCTITQCREGFHIDANACISDERVCTVENGVGKQTWNAATNTWDECVVASCKPGYTNDTSLTNERWKQCGRCNNTFGENGEQAASSYVHECEIASCMYQGEKYILENNECRLICDDYSDETGDRYWDDKNKECVHNCDPGYMPW